MTPAVEAGTGGAAVSHEGTPVAADGAEIGAAVGDAAGAFAAAPAATAATDDPAHGCAGVGVVVVVGGGGVAGAGVGVAGTGVGGGLAVVVEPAAEGGLVLPGVVLVPAVGGVACADDEPVAVAPVARVDVVTEPSGA